MEVFTGTRSRNAVIKRMIEIGLIADRSEILHKKGRKSKTMTENDFDGNGDDEDEEDSDNDDGHTNQDKRAIKIVNRRLSSKNMIHKEAAQKHSSEIALNSIEVRKCMDMLTEDLRKNIDWIRESLNDAAEDAGDYSEDPDDGVPLVPFSSKHRDALEFETFRQLLLALGLQAPAQNTVSFGNFVYRFEAWKTQKLCCESYNHYKLWYFEGKINAGPCAGYLFSFV